MDGLAAATPQPARLARILLPALAGLCLFPFVSTGLGLLLGLASALTLGNPYLERTRRVTHFLLPLSIVGLGAGMDLGVVARTGAHRIVYTVLGIATEVALGP